MTRPQSVWQLAETDAEVCQNLTAKLGISPIIARVLYNRGIYTVAEAQVFINCALGDNPDPFLLKGMNEAVNRILEAVEIGKKILIYGDYDVDGVTSTALLLDVLEELGATPSFHIPDRLEEGYGLNKDALQRAFAQGYGLVVTVDCGISAVEEVAFANSIGLEIIITDHHEPPAELPKALAIINPKQVDCAYPFKHLAGVGVAYKLAQGLLSRSRGVAAPLIETNLLDLLALGTIADLVPINGENRTLVKHGLAYLARTHRVGLQALLEVSGLEDKPLSPGHVGFTLAPRINATGRIGDASIAVQLLRTKDQLRARDMAVYLDGENRERQEIEAQILAEAVEMLEDFSADRDKVIVLAKEGWHPGVIGIVASRLVDLFYRPVILLSLEGEEGKGSGRSIVGFNLYEALSNAKDLLLRYGGHKQAAGLALKAEAVDRLRDALNLYASSLDQGIYTPRLKIDTLVSLQDLSEDLIGQIKGLEPFGFGNPSPLLAAEGLHLVEARGVGKEKNHLKVRVKDQQKSVDGIGFSLVRLAQNLRKDQPIKVAFTPELNEYNGKVSVQLQLKDLQNCEIPTETSEELTACRKELSERERELLQLLESGKCCEASGNLHPAFPILAAAKLTERTGLASIIVYPSQQFIDRTIQDNKEIIATLNCPIHTHPEHLDNGKSAIHLLTTEFFVQNVAKIMEMQLAVLVIDTIQPKLPIELLDRVPVLRTKNCEQSLENCPPSRERLLTLYQVLRKLSVQEGQYAAPLLPELSDQLKEPLEFIEYGLEIFEELDIVRQEKREGNRIIYFRPPSKKLNLTDSGRFLAAQELAEGLSRLQGLSL